MDLFVVWIISMVVASLVGSRKGEAGMGFVVGLLFGPLGVVFALLSRGDRARCPACAEWRHKRARVCPHCGEGQRAVVEGA